MTGDTDLAAEFTLHRSVIQGIKAHIHVEILEELK